MLELNPDGSPIIVAVLAYDQFEVGYISASSYDPAIVMCACHNVYGTCSTNYDILQVSIRTTEHN